MKQLSWELLNCSRRIRRRVRVESEELFKNRTRSVVQNCLRSARKSEEEINECDAERRISSEKAIAAKTVENQQHFLLQGESPEKVVSQIDSNTEHAIKKTFIFLIAYIACFLCILLISYSLLLLLLHTIQSNNVCSVLHTCQITKLFLQ